MTGGRVNEEARRIVLLVEDEGYLREALAVVMRLGGYNVTTACNGRQGLDLLATIKPDVVLTNVRMPVMDGLELARTLRQHRDHCKVPILGITSLDQDAIESCGATELFDHILYKPIEARRLLALVAQAFSRESAHPRRS